MGSIDGYIDGALAENFDEGVVVTEFEIFFIFKKNQLCEKFSRACDGFWCGTGIVAGFRNWRRWRTGSRYSTATNIWDDSRRRSNC